MLGILHTLAGPVTPEQIEDLFMQHVLNVEDARENLDEDEYEDEPFHGATAGLAAAVTAYYLARTGEVEVVEGDKLENEVRKGFIRGFLSRIKKRAPHLDEEYAAESFDWDHPGICFETTRLPAVVAHKLGAAMGEIEAAKTIAMWDYFKSQDGVDH